MLGHVDLCFWILREKTEISHFNNFVEAANARETCTCFEWVIILFVVFVNNMLSL